MFSLNTLIILALGVLLGAITANKDFRRKFFVGFRKFLGGIGSGQRRSEKRQDQRKLHPDEVKYRYIADHHLVKCPRCGGTGKIPKKMPKLLDEKLWGKQTQECPDCEGEGRVWD